MEASDAFAQEIEGKDDPFAGTDLSVSDAFAAEDPPIVDREGNPVENGAGGPPAATDAPQADERALETEASAEVPPTPPESAPPSSGSASGQPSPDPTAPAESAGPTEDPTAPTTPASGDASSSATGGESADPTPAGDASTAATSPTPSEAPVVAEPKTDEEDDAPPPEEPTNEKGKTTKRRYLIFQVDGPNKLTRVTWYEDKDGKLSTKGTAGARRQSVYLASGTDAALKFAYAALGAPQGGVKLVAVAQLHFQVREVKPMPPEPLRQRLQIS